MQAPGARTIRVLLVDMDGGAAREVLSFAPDLDVVAVASFAEAVVALRHMQPAVLIAALANPRDRDVELLRQLVQVAHGAPVLIVSGDVADSLAVGLIKAGAGGYLLMRDAKYLATGVRELVRGGLPMSEPISRLVLQRARRSSAKMAAVQPSTPAAQGLLTDRQREILRLLQHGHSYEGVGIALSLSVNTIRSHLRTIYERLGAATKVEAVMIAMELGILQRTRLTSRPPPPPDGTHE